MKIKEFNRLLQNEVKFNIQKNAGNIDVSSYIRNPIYHAKRFTFRNALVAFSVIVFAFVMSTYVYMNLDSVASISIDINPELKVDVNAFNRITKVYAENDSARELVDNINLKHKAIDKAILAIYDYQKTNDDLNNDKMYLLLGIYASNPEEKEKLDSLLLFDNTKIETIKFDNLVESEESSHTNIDSSLSTDQPLTTETESAINDQNNGSYTTSKTYSTSEALHISDAKYELIVTIINADNEYSSYADMVMLSTYSLEQLFPLYYDSIGK